MREFTSDLGTGTSAAIGGGCGAGYWMDRAAQGMKYFGNEGNEGRNEVELACGGESFGVVTSASHERQIVGPVHREPRIKHPGMLETRRPGVFAAGRAFRLGQARRLCRGRRRDDVSVRA